MIVGQKLALGRTHAHTVVTAHVAEHTITIDFVDGGRWTADLPSDHRPAGPQLESSEAPHTLNFLARTSRIR